MKISLLLVLLLIMSASHSFAADAGAPSGSDAPTAALVEKIHPDLLNLEKNLTRKQEENKGGALTPERYREWEMEFRLRLPAVMERIPPTPDNLAAHARIVALLGERAEAQIALDQALAGNPDNPVLLRTKGQFLLEQNDFTGAAQHGLQAWEKSGHTDKDALGLYHTAKGRVAPTGASSAPQSGGLAPPRNSLAAASDDSRTPYKLPVKGSARIGEVPNIVPGPASGTPAQNNGNGFGLLAKLGVAAGVLLIAWGALPAEKKERLKQELWEQPRQEMKTLAIVGAAAGAVYLGITFIPSLLAATAPAAPSAMVPALAGGGAAGGGVVLQQAAVGTAKAGLLAGGTTLVLKKAWDSVSYAKSESGSQQENKPTQSNGSSNLKPEQNPRSSIKKPSAKNKELQRVIDKLFKESDTKPGGTARAARDEFYSGQPTKGKWHGTPAKERLAWLRRVMREQKLDPLDKATAEAIEADLQSTINLYKITP